MTIAISAGKFRPGQVVITREAQRKLPSDDVYKGLVRHLAGDWGNLDEHDWKENDAALEYGFRLLSSYATRDGTKFWIITEHDRSVTTILLPEEY